MTSLQISDILNDTLVQQTMKALDGKVHRSAPEQSDLDEHPLLQMLEKKGALDSVTAAVIVAEEMTRGAGNLKAIYASLPPQVGRTLQLVQDADISSGAEGLALLAQMGDPVALKLAVAAIAFTGTAPQFDRIGRQMGRNEQEEQLRDFTDLSIEVLDALADKKAWKNVSPALLNSFIEAVENFSGGVGGKFRKQLVTLGIDTLKNELAAEGIDLKTAVVAAPAPGVPYNPSLKLNEVLDDQLVKDTIAALGMDPSDVDLDRNPAFAGLAELNTLDSVTAASLIAMEGRRHGGGTLPKAVKEVADILTNEAVAYGGPMVMFGSDNHTVHKIGMGMLAVALTGPEFTKSQQDMTLRQIKKEAAEMLEAGLLVMERVIEAKSWQSMSPELIDKFGDGIETLKTLVEGPTRKRLLTVALQTLKHEVAKGTGAEVTGPLPGSGVAGPSTVAKPSDPKKFSLKP